MNPGRRALGAALAVSLSALLSTCGGGDAAPPTTPQTPAPPTPAPIAATPLPPDPFPGAASCARIGLGNANSTCRAESPSFLAEMQAAINEVIAENPGNFINTELG